MPNDMQLYNVASLLRRGQALDQLSTGLTLLGALYGLGQYLLASVTLGGLLLSIALVVLGLWKSTWRYASPSMPSCSNGWPMPRPPWSTAPAPWTRP